MHISRFLLSLRTAPAVLLVVGGLLAAGPLFAQVVDKPRLALSVYKGSETDEFLVFDLEDGRGRLADRLRDPTAFRMRPLETNLFRFYGRGEGQPTFGDLQMLPIVDGGGTTRAALFVEASTGYVAYLEDPGKGGEIGEIHTLLGRPFAPVKAADGNFALLSQRAGNGETAGFVLYHAGSGRGLYLSDVQDLRLDPPVATTSDLPKAKGWVSTAPILRSERTVAHLVIDNAAGTVTFLDVNAASPERLRQRSTDLDLNEALAADAYNPSPTRFVPIPLENDDQTTRRVLLVDASTGQMAYLDGLFGTTPTLAFLPQDVYSVLRPGLGDTTRTLTPVPHRESSGATVGAWLIDSLSGSIVYLRDVNDPAAFRIVPARTSR